MASAEAYVFNLNYNQPYSGIRINRVWPVDQNAIFKDVGEQHSLYKNDLWLNQDLIDRRPIPNLIVLNTKLLN